jgi:hypothetical protein
VGPRASLDAVEKRKNPCSCTESNRSLSVRSTVTVLTELPQLPVTDHDIRKITYSYMSVCRSRRGILNIPCV